MLKALPSVFVNNAPQMILPNHIAKEDAPDRRCLRFRHLEHRDPNLGDHTSQSSFRPENTSAVKLESERPPLAAFAHQQFRPFQNQTTLAPITGFPVLSLNKTFALLPCERKEHNNVLCQCAFGLSLDGEMQKCLVTMQRGAESSVQLTLTRKVCKYDEGKATYRSQQISNNAGNPVREQDEYGRAVQLSRQKGAFVKLVKRRAKFRLLKT